MYNEIVYHLDLCILSYHIYGQTLVWPMDPYYEQMRRKGTDRRTNFIKYVKEGEQETDKRLDPIYFDYDQISPWRPAFVKPEDKWDVFNAPKEITDNIWAVYMTQFLHGEKNNPTTDRTKQTDKLYCFEGETGIIPKTGSKAEKKGAKSFMGFVLSRQLNSDGEYDVHIVFRGSRSGSAERAFFQGKFKETGNPDWITDMDFGVLVDSDVSGIGKACRGFQASVSSTKKNIEDCLKEIQKDRKKPPRHIYVTGHSLGGALASHYASLLQKGELKDVEELKKWSFSDIKIYTYGAPVTGDKIFCEFMGINIPVVRIIIDGDPITQEKLNLQGWPVRTAQTHAGTLLKLPRLKKTGLFERHEPSFIRRALIAWLKDKKVDIKNVPANSGKDEDRNKEPWAICPFLIDVLKHPAFKDDNSKYFKEHLSGYNALDGKEGYLNRYMRYFITTLDDNGSYKRITKSEDAKDKKRRAIKQVITESDEEISLTGLQANLKEVKTPLDDNDSYRLLAMCGVLRRLINFPGDAKELIDKKYPELTTCIEKI